MRIQLLVSPSSLIPTRDTSSQRVLPRFEIASFLLVSRELKIRNDDK
jgi:hypothetical protein